MAGMGEQPPVSMAHDHHASAGLGGEGQGGLLPAAISTVQARPKVQLVGGVQGDGRRATNMEGRTAVGPSIERALEEGPAFVHMALGCMR